MVELVGKQLKHSRGRWLFFVSPILQQDRDTTLSCERKVQSYVANRWRPSRHSRRVIPRLFTSLSASQITLLMQTLSERRWEQLRKQIATACFSRLSPRLFPLIRTPMLFLVIFAKLPARPATAAFQLDELQIPQGLQILLNGSLRRILF